MTSKDRAAQIAAVAGQIAELLRSEQNPIDADTLAEKFRDNHPTIDRTTVEMAFAMMLNSGHIKPDREMRLVAAA